MTNKHREIVAEVPHLRRYAHALIGDPALADDMVQSCLDRALRKLHLWREGTNLRAWLITILRNTYVSHLRHVSRHPEESPSGIDPDLAVATPATQGQEMAIQDIGRALQQLRDDQREVVLLVGLEALSYKDTAEVLGIPVGTVMSRLSRGRENLRRLMHGGGDAKTSLRRVK